MSYEEGNRHQPEQRPHETQDDCTNAYGSEKPTHNKIGAKDTTGEGDEDSDTSTLSLEEFSTDVIPASFSNTVNKKPSILRSSTKQDDNFMDKLETISLEMNDSLTISSEKTPSLNVCESEEVPDQSLTLRSGKKRIVEYVNTQAVECTDPKSTKRLKQDNDIDKLLKSLKFRGKLSTTEKKRAATKLRNALSEIKMEILSMLRGRALVPSKTYIQTQLQRSHKLCDHLETIYEVFPSNSQKTLMEEVQQVREFIDMEFKGILNMFNTFQNQQRRSNAFNYHLEMKSSSPPEDTNVATTQQKRKDFQKHPLGLNTSELNTQKPSNECQNPIETSKRNATFTEDNVTENPCPPFEHNFPEVIDLTTDCPDNAPQRPNSGAQDQKKLPDNKKTKVKRVHFSCDTQINEDENAFDSLEIHKQTLQDTTSTTNSKCTMQNNSKTNKLGTNNDMNNKSDKNSVSKSNANTQSTIQFNYNSVCSSNQGKNCLTKEDSTSTSLSQKRHQPNFNLACSSYQDNNCSPKENTTSTSLSQSPNTSNLVTTDKKLTSPTRYQIIIPSSENNITHNTKTPVYIVLLEDKNVLIPSTSNIAVVSSPFGNPQNSLTFTQDISQEFSQSLRSCTNQRTSTPHTKNNESKGNNKKTDSSPSNVVEKNIDISNTQKNSKTGLEASFVATSNCNSKSDFQENSHRNQNGPDGTFHDQNQSTDPKTSQQQDFDPSAEPSLQNSCINADFFPSATDISSQCSLFSTSSQQNTQSIPHMSSLNELESEVEYALSGFTQSSSLTEKAPAPNTLCQSVAPDPPPIQSQTTTANDSSKQRNQSLDYSARLRQKMQLESNQPAKNRTVIKLPMLPWQRGERVSESEVPKIPQLPLSLFLPQEFSNFKIPPLPWEK